MKLFPSKKVVQRDDMRTPDPQRDSRDFSQGHDDDHRSAGYHESDKQSSRSDDGKLHIFTEGDTCYREQDGKVWEKDKK